MFTRSSSADARAPEPCSMDNDSVNPPSSSTTPLVSAAPAARNPLPADFTKAIWQKLANLESDLAVCTDLLLVQANNAANPTWTRPAAPATVECESVEVGRGPAKTLGKGISRAFSRIGGRRRNEEPSPEQPLTEDGLHGMDQLYEELNNSRLDLPSRREIAAELKVREQELAAAHGGLLEDLSQGNYNVLIRTKQGRQFSISGDGSWAQADPARWENAQAEETAEQPRGSQEHGPSPAKKTKRAKRGRNGQ